MREGPPPAGPVTQGEAPAGGDYLDLRLRDFLDRVAAPTAAAGAGPVAATTVALAAGLTAMSAGLSTRQLPDAEATSARARELQSRVARLAQRDAEAYAEVLAAVRLPHDDPRRAAAVRRTLSRAADVPLEIADIGMCVLDLARPVVRGGNPNLRGDAHTACLLAQAGVRAASALVALNLDDTGDPRRIRAAELAAAAGASEVSLAGGAGDQRPPGPAALP